MQITQFCGAILFTSTGKIASTHFIPVALHRLGDKPHIKAKVQAYMQERNIDSTELISCVTTPDATGITPDSIFEPEPKVEAEYLPETVNQVNQQYDEYVNTMFESHNQPMHGGE